MIGQDKGNIIKEWKPLVYKNHVDQEKLNISRDQDLITLEYKNQMEDQVKLNIYIKEQFKKKIEGQNMDYLKMI